MSQLDNEERVNIVEQANKIAHDKEWRFLYNLGKLGQIFKGLGLARQEQIVKDETIKELDRIDPRGTHHLRAND